MSGKDRKILYKNGLVTITQLSKGEVKELRKLRCGIYQDADRVRSVAERDGIVQIMDTTENGIERSRIRVENQGHSDYLHHLDTFDAREYEQKYC